MTNKFDYQINQYQKRIFESFSQGGDKLKNLYTSVDKMICLIFSHDKPHEDNSSNQQLRILKYKKLKELCDVEVECDFTLVFEDEHFTECYHDFLGDLNLYEDLHPDNISCCDMECLRDSYVKTDSQEVMDSYVKTITCNGEPSLVRLKLKPQYQNYQSEFVLNKEEN